jgi:hypothetical protein
VLFAAMHESACEVVDGARSQQRVAGKVIVAKNHTRAPSTTSLASFCVTANKTIALSLCHYMGSGRICSGILSCPPYRLFRQSKLTVSDVVFLIHGDAPSALDSAWVVTLPLAVAQTAT